VAAVPYQQDQAVGILGSILSMGGWMKYFQVHGARVQAISSLHLAPGNLTPFQIGQ
jgi:hypothetical protein